MGPSVGKIPVCAVAQPGPLWYNGASDKGGKGNGRDMKHEEISLRTRKTLAEALKRAMARKPFAKITVSELIRDANVNRKTFYYHFTDIYDLLRWVLEEEIADVLEHLKKADYEDALHIMLDYVEENDHMLNCALDALGREGLRHFFCGEFQEVLDSLVSAAEQRVGVTVDPEYRSFLMRFYEEALVGLLVEWIRDRERSDREAFETSLIRTMHLSLNGILEHCSRQDLPLREDGEAPEERKG